MAQTKEPLFSSYLQYVPDEAQRARTAGALFDRLTLAENIDVFTHLLNKRPPSLLSYDQIKATVIQAFSPERLDPPFFHHPLFAEHPWLAPYVLASRALPAMGWGSNGKPYYVGYKEKGVQTLLFHDEHGVRQKARIPRGLQMGFVNGAFFNPMPEPWRLFAINKEAHAALCRSSEEVAALRSCDSRLPAPSPVGRLVEAGYTPVKAPVRPYRPQLLPGIDRFLIDVYE